MPDDPVIDYVDNTKRPSGGPTRSRGDLSVSTPPGISPPTSPSRNGRAPAERGARQKKGGDG